MDRRDLGSPRGRRTRFVAVRFGNVLNSSGSVIPIFRRQIAKGGPVTVTHPEMTRYFMTIPEAVQLVVQAGAIGGRGQVYVLDMGEPVRIVDLAEKMIRLSGKEPGRDIAIEFIGPKPGEKLHEELVGDGETVSPTSHEAILLLTRSPVEPTWLEAELRELERLVDEGDTLEVVGRPQPHGEQARAGGRAAAGDRRRDTRPDADVRRRGRARARRAAWSRSCARPGSSTRGWLVGCRCAALVHRRPRRSWPGRDRRDRPRHAARARRRRALPAREPRGRPSRRPPLRRCRVRGSRCDLPDGLGRERRCGSRPRPAAAPSTSHGSSGCPPWRARATGCCPLRHRSLLDYGRTVESICARSRRDPRGRRQPTRSPVCSSARGPGRFGDPDRLGRLLGTLGCERVVHGHTPIWYTSRGSPRRSVTAPLATRAVRR